VNQEDRRKKAGILSHCDTTKARNAMFDPLAIDNPIAMDNE
jgi:hypothetical protein